MDYFARLFSDTTRNLRVENKFNFNQSMKTLPLTKEKLNSLIRKALLLSFLLVALFSNGQKPVFTTGIVGALNTSQVSGDDLWGFNQFGAYGGLFLNAEMSETKSIQFHIAYSQKGSRQPASRNGTSNNYVLRFNYIDVPIIFGHRFQKNKMKDFIGEIGIVNSYLINYTERNVFGDITPVRPFKKYEGSLMLGFGYLLKENLYFSMRYVNSVLPIRKHISGANYYFNRGQYNTVMQFSLNYFF
jgi:hypothetical protein